MKQGGTRKHRNPTDDPRLADAASAARSRSRSDDWDDADDDGYEEQQESRADELVLALRALSRLAAATEAPAEERRSSERGGNERRNWATRPMKGGRGRRLLDHAPQGFDHDADMAGLATLADRLDAKLDALLERQDGPQAAERPGEAKPPADPTMMAMTEAIRALSSRLDAMDSKERSSGQDPRFDDLARRIDGMRNAVKAATRVDAQGPRGMGKDINRTMAEISARQRALFGGEPAGGWHSANAAAPRSPAGLSSFGERLDDLSQSLTQVASGSVSGDLMAIEDRLNDLTSRIEMLAQPGAPQLDALTSHIERLRQDIAAGRNEGETDALSKTLTDMRQELAAVTGTLKHLAPQEAIEALAREILSLKDKVDGVVRAPQQVDSVARITADLKEALADVDGRSDLSQLESQISGLTSRIDALRDRPAIVAAEPSPVLMEALAAISHKLDQSPPPMTTSAEPAPEILSAIDRLNAKLEAMEQRIAASPVAADNQPKRAPMQIKVATPQPEIRNEPVMAAAPVQPVAPAQAPLQLDNRVAAVPEEPPVTRLPGRKTYNLANERPRDPDEGDTPIEPGEDRSQWSKTKFRNRDNVATARQAAEDAAEEAARGSMDPRGPRRQLPDEMFTEFEVPEKPSLGARLRGMFRRKPKASAEGADDAERAVMFDSSAMPKGPTPDPDQIVPRDAGLQNKVTRRNPVLVGVSIVIALILVLQATAALLGLRSPPPAPDAAVSQGQTKPDQPPGPQSSAKSAARVVSATPITPTPEPETTGSITATGKLAAPAGVSVAQGWSSSGGDNAASKAPPALLASANRGVPEAAYELGNRYLDGKGVGQSFKDAVAWFEKAAAAGHAPSQYRLGALYEKGTGVGRNLEKARGYYEEAARQGNAKAMHNLAVIHSEGINGRPDFRTAAYWFRRGAEYGVADSQYNLGILHARGLGVDQNLAESYKWFALAAQGGDQDAAKKRDDVAGRLDAATLSAARLAVQTFVTRQEPEGVSDNPAPTSSKLEAPAPAAGVKAKRNGA